jgi:YVTN family beta-propeller protein
VVRLVLALALALSGLLVPSTRVLAQTVVATVGVGSFPVGVGVNPSPGRVYVANENSNTVSVIDGTTNTVIATIGVGREPRGVGVNPSTHRVYVANGNSDTVSVIDGTANMVIATVGVGVSPVGVGVNPSIGRVYVANSNSNPGTVSVIDGTTNTVIATIGVGSTAFGVGVNPSAGRVYVGNQTSNTVSVIDGTTNTVIATVSGIGSGPYDVGVNPSAGRVYVSSYRSNTVSVIQDTGLVSTPGCAVTNHGRIIANNGDKAAFAGNVTVSPDGKTLKGKEAYHDNGPAQPLTVKSLKVEAVACNLSASPKQASIFGEATIDGAGQHTYRIDTTDAGKPGTNDTYRILLDTGYDSGVHKLKGGDVQIQHK